MRILFLDQYSDMAGAQYCLIDLLSPVPEGWKAHAALPGAGGLTVELRRRNVTIHDLPLRRYSLGTKGLRDLFKFLADARALRPRIRQLVRQVDPALIYVNGPRLMPAVWRAQTGVPVLFHAHNRVSISGGLYPLKASIRGTNATIIAASQFLGDAWHKRLPKSTIHVVYGGVSDPGPLAAAKKKGQPFRVGMIGRISPQKRQKSFVLAAADFARFDKNVEFRLYGDALFGAEDYKAEVLAAAPPTLKYAGWIARSYDALRDLDLLVMPSLQEGGVPRVMLEAFAARVPVLACFSGAVKEVLRDGETGFVLAEPQSKTIVEAVKQIIPAVERRQAVAETARKLWEERFTAERYRSELWEILQDLIGTGRT
jgi:glycosyltransferase involved in cell wall biosynthesis